MPDDVTTVGAQFVVKFMFTNEVNQPSSTAIGLYDSQVDTLDEGKDMADLDSEPDDGQYQRLDYTFGSTDFASELGTTSNWRAEFTEKTFDLTNTTGYADSYFEVMNFQAEGETAANDHLFTFGPLLDSNGNQLRIDLGSAQSFDFTGSVIVP